MEFFSRLKQLLTKGLVRDLDHGGWVDTSAAWNFWQSGYNRANGLNNVVYSCVQAYAQTIAQLPGRHMKRLADGHEEENRASALHRIMRKPNVYQTRSDFLLNLVGALLYEGNGYAYATRNNRFEITGLHLIPPGACSPSVIEGEVFYQVTPDEVSGVGSMIAPARDILHVKLFAPQNPLRGETPIYAAAQAINVNNNLMGHQSNFFGNMTRPSGVITTEEKLNAEQTQQLRERWDEQAKGMNSGKVPILTWGLKWQPLSINSVDAQVIQALKFSVEDVARAFRVPLPLIGVVEGSTYNNVYNLMQFWKSSGLGFLLEHIEQAFGALFALPEGERLELDTNQLLRTDQAGRFDALTKAITGGLMSPNEGRRLEGLKPVEGGEMPRVQQQMVPLDYEEPPPAPAPTPDPEPSEEQIRAAIQVARR